MKSKQDGKIIGVNHRTYSLSPFFWLVCESHFTFVLKEFRGIGIYKNFFEISLDLARLHSAQMYTFTYYSKNV